MKRRMIAMLLLAAMVLCMIAPAYAVQQTEEARKIYSPEAPTKATYGEDYVVPFSWTYNSAVVAGGTIEFKFKLNITTPHPDTDKFVFQIFRGTASEVAKDKTLKAIVRQEYSMSQFAAPQNALSITWTAGADFPAGDYSICWGVRNEKGEQYKDKKDKVNGLKVVEAPVPATDFKMSTNKKFEYLPVGDTVLVWPVLSPTNTTSDRAVTVINRRPGVASIVVEAGYVHVTGIAVGYAQFVVRCGGLEKAFQIKVGKLDDFTVTPGQTTLCVERTDTITTSATATGSPVYYSWSSSDPTVAQVKDGVVTALRPGKATITAECYGVTKTVSYIVNYHELPEGTPVSKATATKPARAIGHCSVCGKDNCVNIMEDAVFTDTNEKAWYAKHVDYVYGEGLMKGVDEHTFAPETPVTRAMVVTVLHRIAGSQEISGGNLFPDVPEGKYYTKAVQWAQKEGVVEGFNDGNFHPDENISREQLATILYRYCSASGEEMAKGADLSEFPDVGSVHSYAKKAVAWAVAEGIITGVGVDGKSYLQPQESANRAQFATIISRYLQREGKASPGGKNETDVGNEPGGVG